MISPRRILIVEDDETIRSTLKMALELEGYSVEIAADGQLGLELLSTKPHLVLLDLMMPKVDGKEFLERKSRAPEHAAIPVIVLSASGLHSEVPKANVFLEKPVDLELLFKEIAALV
jgi:two-component system response regulator MprA